MQALTAAPDSELVRRAADGEQAAFAELFARYGDRVHDHVARWSRDATLAADATREAFVALLAALDTVDGEEVLVHLLRTARARAVEELRRTQDEPVETPVATAVLAARRTGPSTAPDVAELTHATAVQVWEAADELDERTFSALDLHVRQDLRGAELAAVLGTTPDDADALVERMQERMQTLVDLQDVAPLDAYAALARIRAPVAVRTGIMSAAAERFGMTSTRRDLRRLLPLGLALVLLLVVGGIAWALRSSTPEPSDGPPTAAGELVASPTPSPSPSPTATLQALPSASPVPVPSPEPTATPEPTPSPSVTAAPSPSPQPSPTVAPLAVSVDRPAAGAVLPATAQDEQGRQAARVAVAATVTGGGDGTGVVWRSDRAPDQVLLASAEGELLLWLSEPCTDTPHVLTVTAADEETGAVATDTVEVLVDETCAPKLTVSITQPADGETFQRNPADDTVTFEVAAEASDDDVTWVWTTDRAAGEPVLEAQRGEITLTIDDCTDSTSFRLVVEVERASDGSTATHGITVNVDCVP